ncbi:MAG TPA: hypothetical protein VGM94_08250 [Galbitalea sp.]|jgi:hypothetical protein
MKTLVIVATGLALLGLTGCTAFQPVAVKRESDGLHISICQDFSGDQLVVDSVDKQNHVATIWRADGAFNVAKKAQYVFGVPPTGMSTVIGPKTEGLSGEYLDVFFRNGGVEGQVAGHFPVKNITSDSWLQSDGSHTTAPCE